LRTTEVIDSFFGFIIDLGFRDYSLSRVSARSGQDQTTALLDWIALHASAIFWKLATILIDLNSGKRR